MNFYYCLACNHSHINIWRCNFPIDTQGKGCDCFHPFEPDLEYEEFLKTESKEIHQIVSYLGGSDG
jgi:hypothetical protein